LKYRKELNEEKVAMKDPVKVLRLLIKATNAVTGYIGIGLTKQTRHYCTLNKSRIVKHEVF